MGLQMMKEHNGEHSASYIELVCPGDEARFKCTYKSVARDANADRALLNSLDITLTVQSGSCLNFKPQSIVIDGIEVDLEGPQQHAGFSFLADAISGVECTPQLSEITIRLLLPTQDGYISWAHFFNARMTDCIGVGTFAGFCNPHQHLTGQSNISGLGLRDAITKAIAGIVVAPSKTELSTRLASLDADILKRFSLPWLTSTAPTTKRLALIEGGFNFDFRQRILEAALSLGIEIVALDRPGHWLEGPKFSHLRSIFIQTDLTLNEGLPNRIVDAVQNSGLQIDGLTSFSDNYLVPTAQAAEILGFPTSHSKSLASVVDKFECRRLATNEPQGFCFKNYEDLQHQVASREQELQYPIIVKPAVGGGSQGVAKVVESSQLQSVVDAIIAKFNQNVLLEPYVDGPEFDANYVLCDGEILFCEISDSLPCAGDDSAVGGSASFLETGIVLPSALSTQELDMIRSSLYQNLLKLGFVTGVFHVEGRLRNSGMAYGVGQDGVLDLQVKSSSAAPEPSVFLLEVNARCPGRQVLCAAAHTYGIDYYVMQLLFAVGEKTRAKALCHSFRGGAQFWCESLYVPATEGGVFDNEDVFEELQERRPDLAALLIDHHCLFKRGDVVPSPESGKLRWIATFLVCSRVSRADALRVGQIIKNELRYVLKPDFHKPIPSTVTKMGVLVESQAVSIK